MPSRQNLRATKQKNASSSLPISEAAWQRVAKTLALAPQHIRIVELVLRNKHDQEIADELGLKVPTVRTYLRRIYDRAEVDDRLALVLRIFELAQEPDSPP